MSFRSLILIMMLVLLVGCNSNDNEEEPMTTAPVPTEKPVIYLYPEDTMEVSVELDYSGVLTYTYPTYQEGWAVIAEPDGKIINPIDGREYSYLFWEGVTEHEWSFDKGFVVPGNQVEEFLIDKLSYLGLLPHEYNEFIVYWVPRMQDYPFNLITFQIDDYEAVAKLSVEPKPDSVLRVFMTYRALNEPIDIEEQELATFERYGFTVIEWGASEVID